MLTAKKNSNLLTSSEACLLTSLVSSGSEKTLLCRALVTIGNKAAFTDNQVFISSIINFLFLSFHIDWSFSQVAL